MQTATDDSIAIQKIQKIKSIKSELKKKFYEMKTGNNNTPLSDEVLQEYINYYESIVDEKQKQCTALNNIVKHLEELMLDTNITKEQMDELRIDLDKILRELKLIKHEMII